MSGHGHDNSGAEERNNLEAEYQALLKVSSSAISGMQKQMDIYAKSYADLTPLGKKHIDQLREGTDGLSDQKSLVNQINKYKKERNFLEGKYKDTGFSIYSDLSAQMKLQIDTLDLLNKRISAIQAVGDASDSVAQSMNDMFTGFEHHLSHIPLLGDMLTKMAAGPVHQLQHNITEAAGAFKVGFGKALSEGKTGFQALKIAGSESFAALGAAINPVVLAIAAIGMAIGIGFARMHELEAAATDFKVQTGLAGQNLHDIESTIHHAQMGMVDIGLTASEVSKAMSDFTNEFSDLSIPAESTAKSVAMMAKQFGVVGSEAAQVNKLFQNMGGLSEQQAQYLAGSVVEMANMAHVAPDTVIKDISQNSKEIMTYTRGNVKEMAKAAVQAAKMGTSLKEASAVSEKLLDFEDSITKELELSALAGRDLNFARARDLAFTGDILGAQQEVVKQLDQMGDISKLDAITKKQIEETTGMELDSLINQQRIRKQFGSLDKDRLAAANALVDAGQDISNISDEELEAQTKRMKSQESMQDAMGKIGNRLSAIGTAFSDMFIPVGTAMLGILDSIVNVLSAVLVPAFKGLGVVLKYAFMPITWAVQGMQWLTGLIRDNIGITSALAAIWAAIDISMANGVINTTWMAIQQKAISVWAGITTAFKEAELGLTLRGIAAGALKVGQYALEFGKQIAMVGVKMFQGAIGFFSFLGPLAIPAAIAAAVSAMAIGKSMFANAGDVMSPADGKTRISTKEGGLFELSPNDDLVAAPGAVDAMNGAGGVTVAGANGGGGAIAGLVNSMITEIRGLRTDLASGKVAVYMDGRLVTAQVASTAAKNPVTS